MGSDNTAGIISARSPESYPVNLPHIQHWQTQRQANYTMRLQISGRLLARNTLFNFIGQAVPLFIGVVSIPYVMRSLGAERFGILSLVWVILGYFTIFDLGLGGATTKYVAEALGRGEEDQVPRLVWTTVVIQLFLGLLSAIVLVLVTPLLVERILSIPPTLTAETKSMFQLLALSAPAVLISGSFSGVLQATQRFDLLNTVRIPSSSLMYLLPFICLIFGFGLFSIISCIVVSRVLVLFALIGIVLRIFPELRQISVSFDLFPRLFAFGSWVTVSNIVGPFLLYFDRFLIGALVGIVDLAFYTAPFEVITRLGIIPYSFAIALFPAFSTLGLTHRENLQRIYIRSTKHLFLILGPLITVLIIFSSNILYIWLGDEFANKSTHVFQILLLGSLFALLAPVPGGLIQGLGRPDLLSKVYLLYLPLNVAVVWWLVKNFGIVGAAASYALRALIETVALFIISSRMVNFSYSVYVESRIRRTLVTFLIYGGLLWVVSFINLYFVKIILGVSLFMLLPIIAWMYLLDDVDRKALVSTKEKLLLSKGVGHS